MPGGFQFRGTFTTGEQQMMRKLALLVVCLWTGPVQGGVLIRAEITETIFENMDPFVQVGDTATLYVPGFDAISDFPLGWPTETPGSVMTVGDITRGGFHFNVVGDRRFWNLSNWSAASFDSMVGGWFTYYKNQWVSMPEFPDLPYDATFRLSGPIVAIDENVPETTPEPAAAVVWLCLAGVWLARRRQFRTKT